MTKKKDVSYGWTDKLYYVTRITLLATFLVAFFSELNPVRIYTQMNKNVSLITAALSYDRLVVNVGFEIRMGYFYASDFRKLMLAAAMIVASIVVMAAAQCVSLGNLKMKKLANLINVAGIAIGAFGVYKTYATYLFYKTIDAEIADAVGFTFATEKLPFGLFLFAAIVAIELVVTAVIMIFQPKPAKEDGFEMATCYKLFIMFLPFILLAFMFSYLPLYGWRYAFFDYHSGPGQLSMNDFVGLKWFRSLVDNAETREDIVRVMKNTFIMSGLGIGTSWVAMAFAIFLSEIKCGWFRRIVQVFTTIPNFISWVLVYAIAVAIFSDTGFLNQMLTDITGTRYSTLYLQEQDMLHIKMLLWGMWKGTGWSAIIYIAGISGIDQQLYEAATVDGAGRFQKMWHVTLPGLLPTYSVLLLMSVAGILSNGMDQYMVFTNSKTKNALEVLDLYVYELGIGSGKIPLSTVVGMLKTVVSVVLLFVANGISKLVRGESIM